MLSRIKIAVRLHETNGSGFDVENLAFLRELEVDKGGKEGRRERESNWPLY